MGSLDYFEAVCVYYTHFLIGSLWFNACTINLSDYLESLHSFSGTNFCVKQQVKKTPRPCTLIILISLLIAFYCSIILLVISFDDKVFNNSALNSWELTVKWNKSHWMSLIEHISKECDREKSIKRHFALNGISTLN